MFSQSVRNHSWPPSTGVLTAPRLRSGAEALIVAKTSRQEKGIFALHLVWILLLVSIVPWRRSIYFEGSMDPVVVAKAAISVTALLIAATRSRHVMVCNRIGASSITLLALFIGVALVGGLASNNTVAASVSSARLVIVASTIVFIVRCTDTELVIRSLLRMMMVLGLFTAASGFSSVAAGARLVGTIPPLNPNDIALLCAVPAIGVLHELVIRTGRWLIHVPLLLVLVGVVWLTGSRTGLVAMLVAFAVVILHARKPRPNFVIALILLVPISAAAIAYTQVVVKTVARGDTSTQDLLTLSARTIAWQAVLATPNDTWSRWIGSGMAVRQVQVAGQFWDNQVLDSSWISALAQAGAIGVLFMVIWVALTLNWTLRSGNLRSIATPIVIFVGIRSFLENGLVDTNVMFVVFFTLALLLEADRLVRGPAANSVSITGLLDPSPQLAASNRRKSRGSQFSR